ncbi:prepilin-type N-terminal cleavage/methylation domain-containing protein [Lysinibacillus sphaericus]|uniref:Prepilin-type N-terminal cleavage/methylation domain-containing protein n=1 Tax=Lysinibacillus sphaericus TaxID=1421 RepID=A0A544UWE9_LYSSH|nr:prepilin-type N-terminal cleavage/methylation domain-containing protein [Lysinibacillus sp. SDF0037]TQR38164.1 prepilin-type N-terminal cleavage/methylation domain-containing protein [Lysinibacillus sp. SDF0037]
MFKKLLNKKLLKNQKGLTLIELLAVIVILAIIAAIAIPAIGNIIENSRVKGAKSDAANLISAANIYYTDNTEPSATFTNTTTNLTDYVKDSGTVKEFTVTREGKITVTKGIVAGKKEYKIDASTLSELEVDKPDTDTDKFSWISK